MSHSAALASPPQIRYSGGAAQLLLHGKPFLMLGGKLGNSSAGTAAQADAILPRLAAQHFNTVLIPIARDEIEPEEGRFDFAVLDHWLAAARRQNLHLVLLWFGSWKNSGPAGSIGHKPLEIPPMRCSWRGTTRASSISYRGH